MLHSIWLLAATIIYAVGVGILVKKRQLLSPYGLCVIIFMLLSTGFKLRFVDLIGAARSGFTGLSDNTEIFVFLSSLAIVLPLLLLKAKPGDGFNLRYIIRVPIALYLACTGVAVLEAIANIVRNGGAPGLLLVADSLEGYSDFQIPHISQLAYGLGRFGALLLAMELASLPRGASLFSRQLPFKLMIVSVGLLSNMMIGLRSLLLLPLLNLAFAYVLTHRVPAIRLAIAGAFGLVFFLFIGNLRVSDTSRLFDEKRFTLNTNYGFLDNALDWYASYTVPNYANLSQILELYPDRSYGAITLTGIIPGLGSVIKTPPSAIEFLNTGKLLPYRGFTFRTIFGDYYPDFGYAGSIVAIGLLNLGVILFHNRSGWSSIALGVYANFASSIAYMAFKDQFLGMPTVIPIFALLVAARYITRQKPPLEKRLIYGSANQ